MSKTGRIVLTALVVIALGAAGAQQALKMFKDGAQAYLFGYPLVLMDQTRQSMTSPETGRAPLNHFIHVRTFPDHKFRQVVRPNNDTLYSIAWLDLATGPLVLSVPDTAGRYYVIPFMDAWTNVFASVGRRATGTKSGNYLIAGPDWQGTPPEGVKLITSPTNMSWVIGRIQTNGPTDFDAVHQLQDRFLLTPLSQWPNGQANPGYSTDQQANTAAGDDPSARVEKMTVKEFFGNLSRLMGSEPPAKADGPALANLARFGIVPGQPFDVQKLGLVRRFMLEKAVALTRRKLVEMSTKDRSSENNWAVLRQGIGVYGADYNVRAFVALIGLGALTPEEAAYPNTEKDRNGQPLSGQHRYRIHFEAGKTPPVDAFWSLTMYNRQGFLIDNPIQRYAIGDRDELHYNTDGSLDILIQHEQPTDGQANWLPAPSGDFAVTMRLYMPKADFLTGAWKLPYIERLDS